MSFDKLRTNGLRADPTGTLPFGLSLSKPRPKLRANASNETLKKDGPCRSMSR